MIIFLLLIPNNCKFRRCRGVEIWPDQLAVCRCWSQCHWDGNAMCSSCRSCCGARKSV